MAEMASMLMLRRVSLYSGFVFFFFVVTSKELSQVFIFVSATYKLRFKLKEFSN